MLKKSFFIPLLMLMVILMTGCTEEVTEAELVDIADALTILSEDIYTSFEELYTYDGDYDKTYKKQIDLYLENQEINVEKIKKIKKMKLPKEQEEHSSQLEKVKESLDEVLEIAEVHEKYLKKMKKVKNLETATKINEEHKAYLSRAF